MASTLEDEYASCLPYFDALPRLTPEEVARYVALGKQGWARARSGDSQGAEASFQAQIAIFPGNPEPYVAQALIAAGRKDDKTAVARLRQAVLRGFTDFPRLDRAEAWHHLRRNEQYLGLMDSVPRLLEIEAGWAGWKQFRAHRPPPDVTTALQDRTRVDLLVEAMAPALGPRLVRLWNRMSARATAARLEAYVASHEQAPDLAEAIEELFDLYTGGATLRWEVLPKDAATRLKEIAELTLQRLPKGPTHPGALATSALARYAERDRKGVLAPDAAERILQSLDEVLTDYPASPFVALAAEGSVRVQSEAGRLDRAGERYRRFNREHAADAALVDDVRERLGILALRLGGLPVFAAQTLEGTTFGSEALRGKVAVLDFWATWCQPCLAELPTLRRIQERHGGDVVLLGVSLDGPDDLPSDKLREWTAREKVPGRQLHDGKGWESDLVRTFGVKEIPFTVVVGPDGSVLAVGERGKKLERTVEAALRNARSRS